MPREISFVPFSISDFTQHKILWSLKRTLEGEFIMWEDLMKRLLYQLRMKRRFFRMKIGKLRDWGWREKSQRFSLTDYELGFFLVQKGKQFLQWDIKHFDKTTNYAYSLTLSNSYHPDKQQSCPLTSIHPSSSRTNSQIYGNKNATSIAGFVKTARK